MANERKSAVEALLAKNKQTTGSTGQSTSSGGSAVDQLLRNRATQGSYYAHHNIGTGSATQPLARPKTIAEQKKDYADTIASVDNARVSRSQARQDYADILIRRDNMRSQAEDLQADYDRRIASGERQEDLADQYAQILARLDKAKEYDRQADEAYKALQNSRANTAAAAVNARDAHAALTAMGAKYGENAAKSAAAGTPLAGAYDNAPGRISTLNDGEYADIMQRSDYASKSQAGESKNTWSGKYDTTYDYINDINGQRGITKLNALQGRGGGDYGKYDFLTKDEIGVYNYLYATEGKKSAEKYLKSLDVDLNAQYQGWLNNVEADAADNNAATKALFSAGTAIVAPARGLAGAAATAQDIYRTATGQEIDPNSSLRRLSQNTQAIREGVSKDMSPVGSFFYNAGMSAADSAVNALTMQGAAKALGFSGDALLKATNILTSATMSSEVTAMSIAESKNKGYSDVGALSLGLIRGGIEYLSEKLGGEWVIKTIKKNPANFFNAMIRAMVPEGIEENMSDIGNEAVNIFSDLAFNTKESFIFNAYNVYKANGSKNPWLDTAKDVATQEFLSFAAGSISAFGNAAVQYKGNAATINSAAKALNTTSDEVVKIMNDYNIENPYAVEVLADLHDADSAKSFREAMDAYENAQEAIDEAMRISGMNDIQTNKLLRQAGVGSVSNQTESAWDVLTGKTTPEESRATSEKALKDLGFTRKQTRAAIDSNRYEAPNVITTREMGRVYDDAQKKLAAEGVTDERLAGAISAVALQQISEAQDTAGGIEPTKFQQKLVNDNEMAQRLVAELVAESNQRVSDVSVNEEDLKNAKYDGNNVDIVGFDNGKVKIRTTDGNEQTVPLERMEVSYGYSTLLEAAAGRENGVEMLRAYKPGQNVDAFVNAWNTAEKLIGAATNYTMEQARETWPDAFRVLSDSQLIRAIESGRQLQAESKKEAAKESEQYKALREEAEQMEKEGKVERKAGTVTFEKLNEKKMNKKQQKVANMVKAVADVLSFDFVLYEGDKNTGGVYIQGGKIYVNINSGNYAGKYIGAATLAHEITHALAEYDKQGYLEFRDFITGEVLTPEELAKLVDRQLALEPNLDPDAALDEAIANGCAKMLLNNDAIQKLAEQNRSLFGWIADKVNEITGRINDAYDEIDLSDDIPVYEAARIFQRAENEIRERWNKMLVTANENKQAEQMTGKKISADKGGREANYSYVGLPANSFYTNKAIYSYDFLTAQDDMVVVEMPPLDAIKEDGKVSRDKAVEEGMNNLAKVGEKNGDVYEVENKYTKRKISAGVNSLRHSLKGDKAHVLRTNARLDAIAGELIQNAIPINGLKKENEQALGTYAMMAIARSGKATFAVVITVDQFSNAESIEAFDVTHAINGRIKREDWSSNKDQPLGENSYGLPQSSTLTIAEVLDIVNETHRGILSKDVLDHFKEKRPKEGYYPGRVLFQMLSPVEQTDKLVAVHNKSVSGLRRMLQRGGVPFPSIAIKKAGTPHEGFGDVSIVFPRSTIDPQVNRQNRLYSNDAWTPTEPHVEYDVGDVWPWQKKLRKIMGDRAYDALKTSSYFEENDLARRLMSSNGDVVEALKNLSSLKYAYLKSIGQEPTMPTTDARLDGFGKYKNEQLLAIFNAISEEDIEAMDYSTEDTLNRVADALNEQLANSFLPGKPEAAKRLREHPLYNADKINPTIIKDAYRTYKNAGYKVETVADDYALDREMRANYDIENDAGYRKWIAETFKGLIKDEGIRNDKDLFDARGNRRSFKALHRPATLENIVAQMQKESEKGVGVFGVNLRGAATKTYSTVEEMRADSGKLLGERISDDVYDSYMSEFHSRLHALTETANKNKDSWESADSTEQILLESLRDAKSKAQMNNLLRKEAQFIIYSEALADDLWQLKQDVQNMPAPYFEAKPRRIVYPGEALAYILPDNADSDVMSELSDRGYNVLTYKAGDEADRLAKLNSVQGAQFQKLGIGETAEEQQARKESFDNLKAENKILRARAEYWKAQTRTTKERTVRQQDTDRLARELLKKYESRADRDEVKTAMKALGDWLVQTDELDYDELYARAEAIAEDIISGNYALLDNSQQENLDRLKDYLKNTPVNLSKSDFRDTGDEGFRKKYGRYFTVSERGRTIDSLWGEMAAMFGEGVFPEDVYAPGDMLNMIADYLDMWKPQYGNEFELFHDEAVNAATNEIIDAVLSEDVRQTPATYADKAQQKLNSQISKDRERLDALREAKNARIEELKRQASEKNAQIRLAEKAAKYEAVSKVKQHYQDMLTRQRNKRGDTKVRAKIKKLHKELSDILLKPKEGRYVPRDLVKATAEILGAVDTTSGRAVKAKAAMAELKVKYDALAKDQKYALTYDETVSGMLQSLAEELGDGSIYDLTGTQLEGVYNVLKSLKHTIVTANKLVGAKIEADAFEAANEMMHETESAKGIPNKMLRRFVMAQMRPSSAFRAFGGYKKNSMWEQMYDELNNGQLTQTQILMEGGQIFRELIDDKKNMAKLHDQKNLVDIGLKDDQGNAIKVTRGMMLSVYMHLLNEQNARHVAYGGLTVPRLKQYYKNQMKDAFNGKTGRAVAFATEIAELNEQLKNAETVEEQEAIKERLAELNDQTDAYMSNLRAQIEEQLTDYDRKWIAAAQEFFDVYSKGKLNEVTEMVYGFEKAQVDNYFPIHTDPDYRAASFDTIVRDMNLENAGFMKERVNGANPILLEDITDVISSQLRRTAQYVGLMPAIRNFNKVYGKARAGYSMSVQSAMARTFENEGKKYIENLMADLTGARKTEANIFDELRGNMAGSVLTLNPRVTLSQAASFPSAAAEIGYKPLMKALTDMKNPMWDKGLQDEIAKWTPLWWYRMQGFSTVELGDIKNNEQFMAKVMDKMKWATGWIQAADGLTTGGLWQASKYYVDDNFSDLKKGSDEYMMKVAEVYNRVLEKTQPDYTTMQRPDILRNPNAIVKQLTMFMSQRLQNTNILYDAAATYSHYVRDAEAGRNGVTAADVKQARTRLAWAVSSQVAAGATIVIFKAIADAIMHNLKAYRDDDDELTAESVSKTLLTNFIETLSGNILWGSEIFSWTKSAITGERYYGVSLNGVDTFKDMLEDGNKLVQKAIKGDVDGAKSAGWKLFKAIGQFFGAPLANGEKFYNMTKNYIEDVQNGTFMEAGVDRTRAQNTHLLFNALQSGDGEKATRIRATFALKSYIQELYTGKDQKIQKAETVKLLQQYAGMTKREAEDTAQKWTMEVVTGYKFSNLQDDYISGEIPKAKAVKFYQTYSSNGRTTQAEAEAKILEWTCEKDTGIAYSDIGNEVKTGRLSKDKAIQMVMKYGSKDEDAATKTVNGYLIEHEYDIKPSEMEDEYMAGRVDDDEAMDILLRYRYYGKEEAEKKATEELERMRFVKANPDAEDISVTQVRNYQAAGLEGIVSASVYADAAKMMGTFHGVDADDDGKTDRYSIIIQKLEYIDTLDLTPEQKTRLAQALGISDKNIKRRAPWR